MANLPDDADEVKQSVSWDRKPKSPQKDYLSTTGEKFTANLKDKSNTIMIGHTAIRSRPLPLMRLVAQAIELKRISAGTGGSGHRIAPHLLLRHPVRRYSQTWR
jgi:hypothetical protein